MMNGMLAELWYVAEGAPAVESLRRVAALGFRYVDIHAGLAHLQKKERLAVKHELENLGLVPRDYFCLAPYNIPM